MRRVHAVRFAVVSGLRACDRRRADGGRLTGLAIFGKTSTELGVSNVTEPELFGADPAIPELNVSSGSSGGSAAAVAARIVPAANANDGGGSIRTPAALVRLSESRPQPDGAQRTRCLVGLHRRACRCAHRTRQRRAARCHCGDYPAATHEGGPAPCAPIWTRHGRTWGRLRIAFSFDPGLGKTLHPENRKALETTTLLRRAGTRGGQPASATESFVASYASLIAATVADAATGSHAGGARGSQRRRRTRHLGAGEDGRSSRPVRSQRRSGACRHSRASGWPGRRTSTCC